MAAVEPNVRNVQMRSKREVRTILGLACLVAVAVQGTRAGVPTREARVRDSGMNPEYSRWRGESARHLPAPKREGDGPWPMACYRQEVTLPAAVRRAAITLMPSVRFQYWFYVNGETVTAPLPARHLGIRNLDLTPFLRPGANVLAFKGEAVGGCGLTLVAEGIVFCEDGSIVRLKTDTSWCGDYNLPDGWEQPGADVSKLHRLRSLGAPSSETHYLINPPHYGPLDVAPVGMAQPIFDEERAVELAVTVLNMRGPGSPAAGKPAPVLAYEILDELSREPAGSGKVDLAPGSGLDLHGVLRCDPLRAGAYRFRLVLTAGDEELDRRDYEVASVGLIRQRVVAGTHYEEGLDLREVWRVDCTAEPAPGTLVTWRYKHDPPETVVKEGPAGRCRTFEGNPRYASFGYRYKVRTLFVPHLVVIEWPDDAPRAFLAQVFEGTTMVPAKYPYPRGWVKAGFQRGDTGFFSCPEHPVRTDRMRKARFIYWPNEEEASVFVYNAGGDAPAAASRITVSEITSDLPAVRVSDAGDRLIGYHTERGPQSMSAAYYAGPLGALFSLKLAGIDHPEFYRNWYTTTENMIKRMRFSGQNLYVMGHFMYNGVLYPSEKYMFSPNVYSAGDADRDYCGLMLRMFERNGLSLISNMEYTCTKEFLKDLPSAERIRAGAPTWLSVNRRGEVHTGGWNAWVSFHHPKVRESVLTLVEELVALYGGRPAWKGVSFILSRWFGGPIQLSWYKATDDPLDWGYEDCAVARFQADTGVRVPVEPSDPERFGKRCEWLLANARQEWVDWRCREYTELYRQIRDRIVAKRPDLRLHLILGEPGLTYSSRPTRQALALDGHAHDKAKIAAALKGFGIDLEALGSQNIALFPICIINESNTR